MGQVPRKACLIFCIDRQITILWNTIMKKQYLLIKAIQQKPTRSNIPPKLVAGVYTI